MKTLKERHPTPWRFEYDKTVDSDKFDGSFTIYNADGEIVMNGGTYTGDGDQELNLNIEQAKELFIIMDLAL